MARQTRIDPRRIVGLACALLATVMPSRLVADESAAQGGWGLGQVVTEGVEVEGILVPPGSTLLDDSLLRSGERPATLHLRGGQVLRLASHSSAHFAQATAGGVRMDVRSGSAVVRGTESKPVTVSEDMIAVLARDGSSRVGYRVASAATGIDADPQEPAGTAAETAPPAISGAKKECLPNVPYPLLDAVIQPGTEVRVAKVYFRAAQHPHFYAVEMTGTADDFEGVLPAPGPGTDQVVYYVEAVSNALESSRTAEYTAEVIDGEECKDRGGALFQGKNPGIALLPTVPGSPLVPPGFLPIGIAGAAGGGLGAGALAGIAGGGLVGGLLLIDELDDADEPPASPVTQ